jgi:hypothetical protein
VTITAGTRTLRNRRAALIRHHGADDPRAREADREYQEALAEERIRKLVDDAPPLSEAVRARLSELFSTPSAEVTFDAS